MKACSTIIFACFAIILISILDSCSKIEKTPTIADRLVGSWREIKYATDDNNAGVLYSWELKNINPSYKILYYFNKNNTGKQTNTINDSTYVYNFTWKILPGDSVEIDGSGHDTIQYQIQAITAASMTLETYSNHGLVWYIFNKN